MSGGQDAHEHYTMTQYNILGRVIATIRNPSESEHDGDRDDMNIITTIKYDLLGREIEVSDPDGQIIETQYDELSRPVIVAKKGQGSLASYIYDGVSQRAVGDSARRVNFSVTDGLGRVTRTIINYENGQIEGSDGNTRDLTYDTRYDHRGRVVETLLRVASMDDTDYRTRYSYDRADRVVCVIERAGDPPLNCAEAVVAAQAQPQTAAFDRDRATTYRYNRANELVEVVNPLGQPVRNYTYDALGRRTAHGKRFDLHGNLVSEAGVSYTYDALGRRMSATGNGIATTYGYDALGRRTFMQDASGLTSYDYWRDGRVRRITDSNGIAMRYGYSRAGALTRFETDAHSYFYEYDGMGRITSVTTGAAASPTPLASMTYQPNMDGGNLAAIQIGAHATTFTDDDLGRPTTLAHSHAGQPVLSFSATYDRRGNTTQMREIVVAGNQNRTIEYAYDGLDRLISEQHAGSDDEGVFLENDITYGYDAVGNRNRVVVNGQQTVIPTTGQQRDDYRYAGDPQYERVTHRSPDSQWGLDYDAADRLTRTHVHPTRPDAATTHVYNGDGVLMRSITAGVTTTYTHDLARSLPVLIGRKVGNAEREWYAYLPGSLLRLGQHAPDGTLIAHLHDFQHSLRATLDAQGRTQHYAYTAFGVPLSVAQHPVFGFAGELHDPLSGLVYLRARWYDPDSGTLLTADPYHGGWQQPYGHHPYQYAYSNPLRFADPRGEVPVLVIIGGVILVGAWLATPPSMYAPSTVEVPAITALPSQKNALGLYPNDTMVLEAGFDTVNDATVLVTGHGVFGGEGDRLWALGALALPGVSAKCLQGLGSTPQLLTDFSRRAALRNGKRTLPIWTDPEQSDFIADELAKGHLYALVDFNRSRLEAVMIARPARSDGDIRFLSEPVDASKYLEIAELESALSGGGTSLLHLAARLAQEQYGRTNIFLTSAQNQRAIDFYLSLGGKADMMHGDGMGYVGFTWDAADLQRQAMQRNRR